MIKIYLYIVIRLDGQEVRVVSAHCQERSSYIEVVSSKPAPAKTEFQYDEVVSSKPCAGQDRGPM